MGTVITKQYRIYGRKLRIMKTKAVKIICTALFIVLILLGIGLYCYDVFCKDKSPSENLFKLIMLTITGVAGLVKLYAGGAKRRNLAFYEGTYSTEIGNAFENNPTARKALLKALRSYNEERFYAAIKALTSLRQKCVTHADFYSVELFIALSYTDMGISQSAVSVYEGMLRNGLSSASVYGNLGSLYASLGMKDEAMEAYTVAINTYPDAHIAYNNLAQLEFKLGDMESAKAHALRAVEINYKNYQASTLLALIYMLEGNVEEETRYTQMAIGAGQNITKLEVVKEYFKRVRSGESTDESDSYESDAL